MQLFLFLFVLVSNFGSCLSEACFQDALRVRVLRRMQFSGRKIVCISSDILRLLLSIDSSANLLFDRFRLISVQFAWKMDRFRLMLSLFVLDLPIAPCATDYFGFRQFNLYFMAKSIKNFEKLQSPFK